MVACAHEAAFEAKNPFSIVPDGTDASFCSFPSTKVLGYCRRVPPGLIRRVILSLMLTRMHGHGDHYPLNTPILRYSICDLLFAICHTIRRKPNGVLATFEASAAGPNQDSSLSSLRR